MLTVSVEREGKLKDFNYKIVKNPEIFMQNRLEAHSDHEFYGSENAEETGFSDFKRLLNGIWKFSYAKNYASAVTGFQKLEIFPLNYNGSLGWVKCRSSTG